MPVDLTFAREVALDVVMPETEQCVIVRYADTAADTLNHVTGQVTKAAPTTVYTGRCGYKLEPVPTQGRNQDVNGAALTVRQRPVVKIPWDAPTVRTGDLVTITASVDASIVGLRLSVSDASGGTLRVLRRLLCARWSDGAVKDWEAGT